MIQIVIQFDETTGQTGLQSNLPMQNRLMWYGLLDLVKDMVKAEGDKGEQRVQLAPAGLVMPKLKDS